MGSQGTPPWQTREALRGAGRADEGKTALAEAVGPSRSARLRNVVVRSALCWTRQWTGARYVSGRGDDSHAHESHERHVGWHEPRVTRGPETDPSLVQSSPAWARTGRWARREAGSSV